MFKEFFRNILIGKPRHVHQTSLFEMKQEALRDRKLSEELARDLTSKIKELPQFEKSDPDAPILMKILKTHAYPDDAIYAAFMLRERLPLETVRPVLGLGPNETIQQSEIEQIQLKKWYLLKRTDYSNEDNPAKKDVVIEFSRQPLNIRKPLLQ
jgi:hypothetical protein